MPVNDRAFPLACAITATALAGLGVLALTLWMTTPTPAGPFYDAAQWAQVDPSELQWLRTQKVPGQGYRCCDESDGTYAEEDIRDGKYWARFIWKHYDYTTTPPTMNEVQSDWMQVPDEAVIHDANRHGAPVVWWAWQGGNNVFIRCYAPGAGI